MAWRNLKMEISKIITVLGTATDAPPPPPPPPTSARSQPAVPPLISPSFICKAGAVGVAQLIPLFDSWREAGNATWNSLIRDKPVLLLQVERGWNPGQRLNMPSKFRNVVLKFKDDLPLLNVSMNFSPHPENTLWAQIHWFHKPIRRINVAAVHLCRPGTWVNFTSQEAQKFMLFISKLWKASASSATGTACLLGVLGKTTRVARIQDFPARAAASPDGSSAGECCQACRWCSCCMMVKNGRKKFCQLTHNHVVNTARKTTVAH